MKVLSKILLILALPMFYALTQILAYIALPHGFWHFGVIGGALLTAVAVFTLSKGKWASGISFRTGSHDIWNLIAGFSLALGLCYAANSILSLFGRNLAPHVLLSTGSFWLRLTIGGLLVPVIEEIVFRGTVYTSLKEGLGDPWALVVQAALYAVFIWDPTLMPFGFVLGLFLALAYSWFKTLWVPIVMHITANVFALLAPDFTNRNLPQVATYMQIGYGVVLMAICAVAILASNGVKNDRKKLERQN
ncbi:MAG: CPBP family intramembrane metalloprotease [Clostridiales bacterium]|jgi:membrane protease YdiL (CAAX protease family)|nr:CPBP family intramembrane metalloprotease [Clostridiales bacterium]